MDIYCYVPKGACFACAASTFQDLKIIEENILSSLDDGAKINVFSNVEKEKIVIML
jgi:Fe-S cluster biogenesis protein NfuA